MAMRIASFERDLKFSGEAFERDIQTEFPKAVRAERDRLIQAGEASPEYTTYVNGREGVREEAVKLPGPIIYEFHYLTEAVIFTLAFLEARSPVRTGRYRRSFFAMVNGRQWSEASEIPAGATVLVTNDQPYSRKIHVGAAGFRTYKGLFEQARQATMQRFQNLLDVYTTFIQLDGGYVLKRAGSRGRADGSRRTRSDVSAGQPMKYPAVKLSLRR